MSGAERCVNPKCESYDTIHEGMCMVPKARFIKPPLGPNPFKREKLNMKHTLTLNLIGATRNQLEGFLLAVPEEAKFSTNIHHNQGDRPWESDSFTAELQAEWTS